MPVLIPERTIDSLFAFEFLSVAPSALLWSPSPSNPGTTAKSGPTTSPGNVDHEVRGGRRFDVECKTIYEDAAGNWVNEIPNRQLRAYVQNATAPMFYLLPAEPMDRSEPWLRTCASDPDAKGRCSSCRNQTHPSGLLRHRRRSGYTAHYRAAPAQQKLQAWFDHWAWCVRPADLLQHIGRLHGPIPWGKTTTISALDRDLAAIPGAIRFCHLLSAVGADWRNRYVLRADDVPADDDPFTFPADLDEWSTAGPEAINSEEVLADEEPDVRLMRAVY